MIYTVLVVIAENTQKHIYRVMIFCMSVRHIMLKLTIKLKRLRLAELVIKAYAVSDCLGMLNYYLYLFKLFFMSSYG